MLTHGTLLHPELDGFYLQSFDPEAMDGMGTCAWTVWPDEAMKFDNAFDGFKLWTTVSKTHPVRLTDGKPNRPLSAHTIEMVPYQEAR